MTYKAGNGRFVSKSNPVAVINRLNEAKAKREREQADREAQRLGELSRRYRAGRA